MTCRWSPSGRKPCYGKRLARAKARKGQRASGEALHAYRCACGWWHVGHQSRGDATAKRQAEAVALQRLAAAFARQGIVRG